MNTLKSLMSYSFNSINNDQEELLFELNLIKKKIEKCMNDYNVTFTLQSPPSSYHEFLLFLLKIFTCGISYEINSSEFEKIIQCLEEAPSVLMEPFATLLMGFYITHNEYFPGLSHTVLTLLKSKSKNSLILSHMLVWNLLSCKNAYKKHLSLSDIKSLITDLMTEWGSSSNSEDIIPNVKPIYTSLFAFYSSFSEFADKNLVVLGDLKSFIQNGYIKWNDVIFNTRQMMSLDENEATKSHKWRRYISTINFVNDLISISDILKYFPELHRNKILKELLNYINRNLLPANIYLPFSFDPADKDIGASLAILEINDEFSFCLSTKDRVPFHILLEIANCGPNVNTNQPEKKMKEDSLIELDYCADTFQMNEKFDDYSSENEHVSYTPPTSARSSSFFTSFLCCFDPRRFVALNGDSQENSRGHPEKVIQTLNPDSVGLYGKQKFNEISNKIASNSNYKDICTNRKVVSFFIKGGDDMRQDQFVSNIIQLFLNIFEKESIEIYLLPLHVLSTGRGGIIQTISDTTNLMKINKCNFANYKSMGITLNSSFLMDENDPNSIQSENNLKNYFIYKYGKGSEKYDKALCNFISSLAGYSLLCYILEVKDRNNGNILIDDYGHMVHIDFGFLLSTSPGNVNFEKAPFKLTGEFVDLMNGIDSNYFIHFTHLMYKGFMALRKHSALVLSFVEMYMLTNSDLSCFAWKDTIIEAMAKKFVLQPLRNDELLVNYVNSLISSSIDNWRTKMYDKYQKFCVGVN